MRFLPIEAQAKESCRLLLYVIGSHSLSVASLVEVRLQRRICSHLLKNLLQAASFIGEGRSIVLCLNNIADGTEINGVLVKAIRSCMHEGDACKSFRLLGALLAITIGEDRIRLSMPTRTTFPSLKVLARQRNALLRE